MDPFHLFGIPYSITIDYSRIDEIYFNLQRLHHPDRNNDASHSSKINQAYSILTNDQKIFKSIF